MLMRTFKHRAKRTLIHITQFPPMVTFYIIIVHDQVVYRLDSEITNFYTYSFCLCMKLIHFISEHQSVAICRVSGKRKSSKFKQQSPYTSMCSLVSFLCPLQNRWSLSRDCMLSEDMNKEWSISNSRPCELCVRVQKWPAVEYCWWHPVSFIVLCVIIVSWLEVFFIWIVMKIWKW